MNQNGMICFPGVLSYDTSFLASWHIADSPSDGANEPSLHEASSKIPFAVPKAISVDPIGNTEEIPENRRAEIMRRLEELYFTEGLQSRVVHDIGFRLYHLRENRDWLKHHLSRQRRKKSKTVRSCKDPKPLPPSVPFNIVLESKLYPITSIIKNTPGSLSLQRYRQQEVILYSLDRYIHRAFDCRGGKWQADLHGFVHAERRSNLDQWQCLSDQVYGVSQLIAMKSYDEASVKLDATITRMKGIFGQDDPSFLVKFWRITLGMRGIDGRRKNFKALSRLLLAFESVVLDEFGKENPLRDFVKSLQRVALTDLKNTLRLGFDKTLRTMTSLIGDENGMLLHMWSVFFKYWDAQYLSWTTLSLKFDLVWHKIHAKYHPNSEPAIAITYYFTHASYYLRNTLGIGDEWNKGLFSLTSVYMERRQKLYWGLPALAFAFSARIEAMRLKNNGDLHLWRSIIAYAIQRLEDGDNECGVRAMMLTRISRKWYLESKYPKEVNDTRAGECVESRISVPAPDS